MASAIHAASPPYPPPSFSQNSADILMNGVHSSQPGLNSFDASRSVVTTPTPTPPASRGNQQIMSFNSASFGPPNGYHPQQNTPRAFAEANGNHSRQYSQGQGQQPQIYTAMYSGVNVYEMMVGEIAVMRRRNDSWLNATQILKVAGVEKGKRTKVLEKEILSGEYEKVQGGYGKYQGTWINYRRGLEFCHQYGVEELLRPLLQYDMGQDGMTVAGQGSIETPTKEQAMAAQRKRNMMSGGVENRPSASSPNGTFFKNISKTAANAVSAINKARFDSPGPRPSSVNKRPNMAQRSSQQMMGSQESAFGPSSQQSMQSMHSEHSFSNSQLDPSLRAHNGPYYSSHNDHNVNGDLIEPPRKRARPSSSQDPFGGDTTGAIDTSMHDLTPIETADSFHPQHFQPGANLAYTGLPPLPQPSSSSAVEKQQLLTSLFLDPAHTDFSKHQAFQRLSGEDLDIPIDGTAHTALHWAATLAHTSLVRALINKGASIFRLNGGGETALIRAALTTNNMDNSTFPELLELLGPTIEIRDGRGRTVLHHIAVSSAVKGRGSACRYYLECLLEFCVRQGSAPNSQQNSFQIAPEAPMQPAIKSMSLARFMAEIVNAPDMSGDTALNLAARVGNRSIIHQLIEVGANPTIPNRGGLKPIDFGVGGEPESTDDQPISSQVTKADNAPASKVHESSQDLMASMQDLLTETSTSFKSELQQKQSLIDQTHLKLREATSLLADERRRLASLEARATTRNTLRQQVANLRRANAIHRDEHARSMNHGAGPVPELKEDVKVGEADAGLQIDTKLFPPGTDPNNLTPQQLAALAAMPSTVVLQARTEAYKVTNKRLEQQATQLKSQSFELEAQMKRVISLCTGVEEGKVDAMLESLKAAVESERGGEVDVGRLREFLRRVERSGE